MKLLEERTSCNISDSKFTLTYTLFHKKISGPYTIPSGIVTTTVDVIERFAHEIPEIGILTTKSVGPVERAGNVEPVYSQIDENAFTNAVGLANPGCDAIAKELSTLKLPSDKFLLVSVFGGNEEDFARVAKTVSPYADGLELNFSCPHTKGLGALICSTPQVAASFLKAVKAVTTKPVLCKLSPNVAEIEPVVEALVNAGADGFTAINTVGPVENVFDGQPILSNVKGGRSGPSIKEQGIKQVKRIREQLKKMNKDLPIIGMGGISSYKDVTDYKNAGANFFGIGTALTGMSTEEVKYFFAHLEEPGFTFSKVTPSIMKYRKVTLANSSACGGGLKILTFKEKVKAEPGQFMEVWLPGIAEKPYAQAMEDPFTLVIREIGPHTKALGALRSGDCAYMRGPYGKPFCVPANQSLRYVAVGGGTGIAPLLLLARKLSENKNKDIHIFLGGRTKDQIYFLKEFEKYATVHTATEDGSLGYKGFITGALSEFLAKNSQNEYYFYNCGPELMMKAAFEIQKKVKHKEIECSIERYMKCGVGICGICSCDGLRTCVDGPVLDEKTLSSSKHFGKFHRKKTGELVVW